MVQQSKLFYRTVTKNQSEGTNLHKGNLWRIVGFSLTLVFIIAIISYSIWQVKVIIERVYNNWNELKFTYSKPELIKPIRQDYEAKTKKLDATYAITPTATISPKVTPKK